MNECGEHKVLWMNVVVADDGYSKKCTIRWLTKTAR